ncbi:MAG: hypothetical protein ACREK1_09785 [Longimicrobiales bacterium]
MNEPSPSGRMARDIRFLKMYAAGSSLAVLMLLLMAFAPARHRFQVLQAERIDIIHPDGTLALVLSGKGRLPGPTSEGREYPQELSGGRTTAAGMIFFNERGDEVGGLTYQGQLQGDGYRASGGITFDQFRQDQVVSLQYSDNGSSRSAGVNVWDRSTEITIAEILEIVDARAKATGAARDSIERVIQGLSRQGLSTHRVFVGSRNRTAVLQIRDTRGRPRIVMSVDSTDVPRLVFLDSAGAVVSALPD